MKLSKLWPALALSLLLAALVACVPTTDPNAPATIASQAVTRVAATMAAMPSPTPLPTYTPYPTYTPRPTLRPAIEVATPTIAPIAEEFLTLEGVGPLVTDNYEWGACEKAVFEWMSAEGQSIDIRLHQVGDLTFDIRIVDENGLESGEGLARFDAGTYFLEVRHGSYAGWTLRGVCEP